MSERIHEILLVTRNLDGSAHIAPMGLRQRDQRWLIAPFKPSRTLENLLREGHASINTTDDVRVYAGCLTGRRDWPLAACDTFTGWRLRDVLAHREIKLTKVDDDEQRPRLFCDVIHEVNHRAFSGYNRAQAAVLELAILASRLGMLSADKIDREIEYLKIAIDKTAGDSEREAWEWLMQSIEAYRRDCA